jgi:hypothetical protein
MRTVNNTYRSMNYLDVCIIDDDKAKEGWRLLIGPLEELGFIVRETNPEFGKSDAYSKLVVDKDREYILCYKKAVGTALQNEPMKGVRFHILTSGKATIDLDDLFQKADAMNADMYIIDINLKYIKPGSNMILDAEIAGTLIKQRLKPGSFKIIYSAKNKRDVILTGDDDRSKSIFIENVSNRTIVIKQFIDYLTRLQAEKINQLSLLQRQELLSLANSLGSSPVAAIADQETSSGWSLRTLFPQQVNTLITADTPSPADFEQKKNEMLVALGFNFRSAFKRFYHHGENQLFLDLLTDLDFVAGKKNGAAPVDFFPIKKLIEEKKTVSAVRSALDYKTYDQLEDDLLAFFKKKSSPADSLSIALPKFEKSHKKLMVEKFGIHYAHFLYILKIAVMNMSLHQQNETGPSQHRLQIGVSCPNEERLQVDIAAGSAAGRSVSYDPGANLVNFFKGGSPAGELDLNDFSADSLSVLNQEKLIDILKIVCYAWQGSFSYICGNTGIQFNWNPVNRKIMATPFVADAGDQINYVIHCDLNC